MLGGDLFFAVVVMACDVGEQSFSRKQHEVATKKCIFSFGDVGFLDCQKQEILLLSIACKGKALT